MVQKQRHGYQRYQQTYTFNVSAPPPAAPQKTQQASLKKTAVSGKKAVKPRAEKAKPPAAVSRKRDLSITALENKIVTVRAREKRPLPIGFILTVFVCTSLFMVMIYGMVRINDHNRTRASLVKQVNALTVEKGELESALERKNNLRTIEEYAVNKLGMVKSDAIQKEYVKISGNDKIELVDESGGKEGILQNIIQPIQKKISLLLEYLK